MKANTKYYKYFFGCTCSKCMDNNGIYISESNKIPLNICPYCQKSIDISFCKGMIGEKEVSEILPDGTEYEYDTDDNSNDSFVNQNDQEEVVVSPIGSLLKTLSIILLIIVFIWSIILCIQNNILIGCVMFFSSALLMLIAYGIGEICCKLTSIESKL